MSDIKKRDNAVLGPKLAIRRHMLKRYHASSLKSASTSPRAVKVMDCCAGYSKIWTALRRDWNVNYWAVDKRNLKHVQKIDDAARLVALAPPAEVFDIDTYGSPWEIFFALLGSARLRQGPLTVFLTSCMLGLGGGGGGVVRYLGCSEAVVDALRPGFSKSLYTWAEPYLLQAVYRHRARIVSACEAHGDRDQRYIGLRLEAEPKP